MYGSDYGSSGLESMLDDTVMSTAAASVTFIVLSIIAFIAAVVGTVLIYQKYIGRNSGDTTREAWSWRTFWRFDKLLIEPILKALYIFNALLMAFGTVAIIISGGVGGGFGAFFLLLILGAIICFFQEVILRLGYELIMIVILILRNTGDIRRRVCGDAPATVTTPAAPLSTPPVAPVPAPAVEADTWTCPVCGRMGNGAAFCPKCGAPRP